MFAKAFTWHFVTFMSVLILASHRKYITVTLKQKFGATTNFVRGKLVAFKEFYSSGVILKKLTPQSCKRQFDYLLRLFTGCMNGFYGSKVNPENYTCSSIRVRSGISGSPSSFVTDTRIEFSLE